MPLTINITERAKRSDPLSYQEVDNNFLSLKNAILGVDGRLSTVESTPAPTGGLTTTQVNSLIDTKIQAHLTSAPHGSGGGSTVDMSAYLTKTDAGNTYAAKSHAHAEYAATGHTHDYAASNHTHAGTLKGALTVTDYITPWVAHGNITYNYYTDGYGNRYCEVYCPGATVCVVSSKTGGASVFVSGTNTFRIYPYVVGTDGAAYFNDTNTQLYSWIDLSIMLY